jgi:hypothetical protein
MNTQQKRTAGVAVASLVLGIFGMILIGPLGSIPAIVCGHVAKSKIKQNPETLAGDGMALAGLILGYVQIGFMVLVLPLLLAIAVPNFLKARDVAQETMCMRNMKQIAMAKENAALTLGLESGATIQESQMAEYLQGGLAGLGCPKQGAYTINPVGVAPACSVHGPLVEGDQREQQAPHRSPITDYPSTTPEQSQGI